MEFKGEIITKTSKTGNPYTVLKLTYNGFEKEVYLDKAEIQLLQLLSKSDKEEPEMPFLR